MVCSKCGWVSSWFTFVQANSLLVSRTEPRLLRSRCLPFHYSLKALKPSGHYMYRTVVNLCTASLTFSNSTFCPHSVFMCFVWIWEQTAIISLYNINWLVCITETQCVYCAVRTGSLYTASLTFSNSTFCPHSVFMCFVWIWKQTAIISLYSINWLVSSGGILTFSTLEAKFSESKNSLSISARVLCWPFSSSSFMLLVHIQVSKRLSLKISVKIFLSRIQTTSLGGQTRLWAVGFQFFFLSLTKVK